MKKFLKKFKVAVLTAALSISSAFCVFAEETSSVVTADQFSPVLDALKEQINVGTIMAVLVVVVGAGVGLAFMWWGVRKVTGALMAAFKKGKVKV